MAAGGVLFENVQGSEKAFAFHDLLAQPGAKLGDFIKVDIHARQDSKCNA